MSEKNRHADISENPLRGGELTQESISVKHPLESSFDMADDFYLSDDIDLIENDDLIVMEAHESLKDKENDPNMEITGNLEKLADGFLSKGWNSRWCIIKNNRFGYYGNEGDMRAKAFVHLDEVDIGIPANLIQSIEYRYCFQIVDTQKRIDWYFRAPNEKARNEWLRVFDTNKKYYNSQNEEMTVMERLIMLSILKIQKDTNVDSPSFNYHLKRTSVGSYAIAAGILMELCIRGLIDVIKDSELVITNNAKYTGVGLLDDTLDLIAIQIKSQDHSIKIIDILPMLLEGGWGRNIEAAISGEGYLHDPIKRSIHKCVRNGYLAKEGPNAWIISDPSVEEEIVSKMRDVSKNHYRGNNTRDRLAMGIAYSMIKLSLLSNATDSSNEFIDKNKVFPDIKSIPQWDSVLDAMYKNLGYFEHKHAAILKTIYSCAVSFVVKNS